MSVCVGVLLHSAAVVLLTVAGHISRLELIPHESENLRRLGDVQGYLEIHFG